MCLSKANGLAAGLSAALEIKSQEKGATASSGAKAAERSPKRPLLRIRANEAVTARWSVRMSGGTPAEDVLVHFYVAHEDQAGQEQVDLKPSRVVVESALTMDFKGKEQVASATIHFKVAKPGLYMARVEGVDPNPAGLESPRATLDLEVE